MTTDDSYLGHAKRVMAQGGLAGLRGVSGERSPPDRFRARPRGRRGKADNAKPLHGIEGSVFEITADDRSGTYRAVYALKLGADIWVVHAFQKKSVRGIRTPQREIEVIRDRIKRLRESLR
jgi:Gp49-like protein DUF891